MRYRILKINTDDTSMEKRLNEQINTKYSLVSTNVINGGSAIVFVLVLRGQE